MNTRQKLDLLYAIGNFSQYGTLTAKGMTAFAGDHHSDEKHVFNVFPDFSWSAKQAIQLALLSNRLENSHPKKKLALLEIAKVMPSLRPPEILVLSVALEHGVDGLKNVRPLVKLLKVRK